MKPQNKKSEFASLQLDSLFLFLKKEKKNLQRIILKFVIPFLILSIIAQPLLIEIFGWVTLSFYLPYHYINIILITLTYLMLFAVISVYISLYTYSETKITTDKQVSTLLIKMLPKFLIVGSIYAISIYTVAKIWFIIATAYAIIASFSLYIAVFEDWKLKTIIEKNIEIIKNPKKHKYLETLIVFLVGLGISNYILGMIFFPIFGYGNIGITAFSIISKIIYFAFYTFWIVLIFSFIALTYVKYFYEKKGTPNMVIVNVLNNVKSKRINRKTSKKESEDRFNYSKQNTKDRFSGKKGKNRFKDNESNRFIDDDGGFKF